MSKSYYLISTPGYVAGLYLASTETEALDRYAQDAGYSHFADACKYAPGDNVECLEFLDLDALTEYALEARDALVLYRDGRIELVQTGCQPSNTFCLACGETDWDDYDWIELEDTLTDWACGAFL